MKILKRLQILWSLTKNDQAMELFETLNNAIKENAEMMNYPTHVFDPKGKTKAVFMGEGTQEEYEEFERAQSGWKKFFDKINAIIKP